MKQRPFQRFIALTTLLLFSGQSGVIGSTGTLNLPNIGETSDAYISTDDEQRYGEALMRSIRRALDLVDDPEVQNYIESLGNRLVANNGIRDRTFTFFTVRDPAINAFAAPGGYIGMNTGLIVTSQTEAELASVMAHEIAHITQRHFARAFEAASRMSMPMTAALIAAILLGSRAGGQATEAAIAATAAGSIQQQINFTRANEQEADRIGLQILADSGYEPRAMPRFFEHLQQASQFYDNLQLEFLRTHPVTITRISDTRNRAEQYPEMREAIGENYAFIREKVRVLQDANPEKSLAFYENSLPEAPEAQRDSLRYGYAVALNAAGRHAAARAQLAPLIMREPERIIFQVALAEAALGQGRLNEAIDIYARNLRLYPYHLPLTLYRAQALLQAGRAGEASELVSEFMRARGPRPELYRLLAEARDALNDRLGAHQALAEYYYLRGDMQPALEQLRLALRDLPEADTRAVRIRARVETLQQEWRQRAKISGETVSPDGG